MGRGPLGGKLSASQTNKPTRKGSVGRPRKTKLLPAKGRGPLGGKLSASQTNKPTRKGSVGRPRKTKLLLIAEVGKSLSEQQKQKTSKEDGEKALRKSENPSPKWSRSALSVQQTPLSSTKRRQGSAQDPQTPQAKPLRTAKVGNYRVVESKGAKRSNDGKRTTFNSVGLGAGSEVIQIEVGKFMRAVVKRQKCGPDDCIGKVCEIYEEAGEHQVKLQRYARQIDMQTKLQRRVLRDAPQTLEANEIVETNEFMIVPASGFRDEVFILSVHQFKTRAETALLAQTFFCARALCPDGSQVLWPIDWRSDCIRESAAINHIAELKQQASGSQLLGRVSKAQRFAHKQDWEGVKRDDIRKLCSESLGTGRGSKAELIDRLVAASVPCPKSSDSLSSVSTVTAETKRKSCQQSKLERTASCLRPGAPTPRLLCRDEERKEVYAHLRTAIRQGCCKQVLYVSGMPGTGKTASLLEAVDRMGKDTSIPPFTFIHINAMCLGSQHAVFSEIHRKVLQQSTPGANPFGRSSCGLRTVGAATAHTELTELFASPDSNTPPIFLLVDEVDQLVTANQAVLYRLFDWLALPGARLVMAAISNTMDLPERLLPRVTSRLGVVRVDYRPYSRSQIHQILKDRLESCGEDAVFSEDALKLCAARVAAGSGDVRKALQLCRRAIELQLRCHDDAGPVSIKQLDAAVKDLLHSNAAAQAVARLSLHSRRFLLAVAIELRKQNTDFISLPKVAARYERMLACKSSESRYSDASLQAEAGDFSGGLLVSPRYSDDCVVLAARLVGMSILAKRCDKQSRPDGVASQGPMVGLGASLDLGEMENVLADVSGDDDARTFIHEQGCVRISL